ncbi:hypothetical protein M0R45_023434 [Rubus argutus]|uniref:Uncharacterized protein n=1 Tax=Rubus argutus TaxID=59490 RepID=A0AAW1WS79_RUBAR
MDVKAFLLKVITKLGWVSDPPAADQEPPRYQDYWVKILVVFCSASSIELALLSAQIQYSQLPPIFCFLGITIILSFTCFFVSKSIHFNYPLAAHVLDRFGIFFGVTAIFISITIPFPLWFKCLTCFIYVLCWLTILFCNYLPS